MLEHFASIRKDSAAPWPGPRGPEITLGTDLLNISIRPEDGCRITSIKAHGTEILRQWSPEKRGFQYGCFPMVPWVGRVGGGLLYHAGRTHQLGINRPPHALHGLACFRPWTAESDNDFSLDLSGIWPWDGCAQQHIEVNGNTLAISLVISTLQEEFPAQAGWHPWFNRWLDDLPKSRQNEAELTFDADWQEESGENQLPTGIRIPVQSGPWDDCFGNEHPTKAIIRWPGLMMSMESTTEWLTVFTKPDDSFCVEPLTGPPQVFLTTAT